MQSLSIIQLQNMFLAFCSHIITQKQRINSINVFPVPDQDTGTNLASTFVKVKEALEGKKFTSLKALSEAIENSALYSAQGNSGIIYTGFIAGFFESLNTYTTPTSGVKAKMNSTPDVDLISPKQVAAGFKAGTKKAYLSIELPQRGTILDVMDAVAETMVTCSQKTDCNFDHLFKMSFLEGKKALENTKAQMIVLRESDVVDAGGLAFVMMLESFYESLTGKKLTITEESEHVFLQKGTASITTNRYEVIFIVKKSLMNREETLELLSPLGVSLDIIEVSNSIKVHIHTDQAETVKEIATSLGTVVFLQLMDMKEEKILELLDNTKQ